ncbi:hypothetical protein TcCL_NonESM08734 [Trypanosoma cruzi]|nr:hypothetical protein TcCL_NonESM08734 [Trypanosoma cruzi]
MKPFCDASTPGGCECALLAEMREGVGVTAVQLRSHPSDSSPTASLIVGFCWFVSIFCAGACSDSPSCCTMTVWEGMPAAPYASDAVSKEQREKERRIMRIDVSLCVCIYWCILLDHSGGSFSFSFFYIFTRVFQCRFGTATGVA